MKKSRLIVVEGPQGSGKTTVTDFIRHRLKHVNLYRLTGTSDSTASGLKKASDMYDNLLNYMKTLENKDIDLLFDRTFFTEEIYCRLGYKEYSFTEEFNKLIKRFNELDFDIYYITLYLEDTSLYEKRLQRKDKAAVKYASFNKTNSRKQQEEYLKLSSEIEQNNNNIKVYNIRTDIDQKMVETKLKEILQF